MNREAAVAKAAEDLLAEGSTRRDLALMALENEAGEHERRAAGCRAIMADWPKLSEAARYEIHQLLLRSRR